MSKDTISYYLNKKPNIIFGSPALLDLIMKNRIKFNMASIHQNGISLLTKLPKRPID